MRSLHGGGLGIRTLATVTRPNDLANRPLQPLIGAPPTRMPKRATQSGAETNTSA